MIAYTRVSLYAACRFSRIHMHGSGGPSTTSEYTEGGLHKPFFDSDDLWVVDFSAGNQLYNSGNVVVSPRKGHEFDEIELPLDYNEFNGLTSIKKTPTFITLGVSLTSSVNGSVMGWIDSIEPIATKGPSHNCRIRWHIDYWLTEQYYIQLAKFYPALTPRSGIVFGAGRIKRGPESLKRPDSTPPRKWIHGTTELQITDPDYVAVPFCIILYTVTTSTGDSSITKFFVNWFPIGSRVDEKTTMDLGKIYGGLVEEIMSIAASSIVGIWFSPVAPYETDISTVQSGTYDSVTYGWYHTEYGSTRKLVYFEHQEDYDPDTATNPNMPIMETTDREKFVILDPTGNIQATIPWGFRLLTLRVSVDIGPNGCYLMLRGGASTVGGLGLDCQIPLPSASVTSNAYGEYVLSGQREYDMVTARIQQDQNMKSGIAGAGTGAIGGAIAGSAVAPGVGTVAGLIGGAVSSLVGTFASGIIQEEADRKSQAANDKLVSNQISNVLISSGGPGWYYDFGGYWYVMSLVRDTESDAEIAGEQSELGFITDAYAADCSSIISQGGGIRIEGLEVKGDIPAEGRTYIAALFARGVHLDLIS